MSIQEKRILANMISTVVITTIFAIIVYNKYMDVQPVLEQSMKFWATALLLFIPASIAARIIIIILFNIGNEIAGEISGQEPDDFNLVDERDKLIDLQATRISLAVFSLGFILALVSQVLDYSIAVFFVTSLIGGFIAEMASEIFKIGKYRGWC